MTVSHHGDAAHDHELDPRTGERVNESSKVGRHLRAGPLRGIPRGAASVRAVRSVSAAGSPRSGSGRCSAACAGAVPSAREARSRWCSSRFQDTRAGAPLPPLRAVGGGRCQCVSPPCDENSRLSRQPRAPEGRRAAGGADRAREGPARRRAAAVRPPVLRRAYEHRAARQRSSRECAASPRPAAIGHSWPRVRNFGLIGPNRT